jgi:hypothetical protein
LFFIKALFMPTHHSPTHPNSKKKGKSSARRQMSDSIERRPPDLRTQSVPYPVTSKTFTVRQLLAWEELTITNSLSAALSGGMSFQLGDITNSANFVGVFDQYRFLAVRATLIPRVNNIPYTYSSPPLYTAIDYDNSTGVSVSAIRAYQNCVESQWTDRVERTFCPHMAVAAYNGSLFTGYANDGLQWIDCSSGNIPHYGLKWASDLTTTVYTIDVELEYWLEFRNVI